MLNVSPQSQAALDAANGGNSVAPCPKLAALREERRQKAMDFFMKDMGFSEAAAEEALTGIDLDQPVEVVDIPPPATMSQYVRKSSGRPGNWFNPDPKQTPDMIGLNADPNIRELKTFETPKSKALKSTAKPIVDNWTDRNNPVSTKGGGIQMTVSDATRDAFVEIRT